MIWGEVGACVWIEVVSGGEGAVCSGGGVVVMGLMGRGGKGLAADEQMRLSAMTMNANDWMVGWRRQARWCRSSRVTNL